MNRILLYALILLIKTDSSYATSYLQKLCSYIVSPKRNMDIYNLKKIEIEKNLKRYSLNREDIKNNQIIKNAFMDNLESWLSINGIEFSKSIDSKNNPILRIKPKKNGNPFNELAKKINEKFSFDIVYHFGIPPYFNYEEKRVNIGSIALVENELNTGSSLHEISHLYSYINSLSKNNVLYAASTTFENLSPAQEAGYKTYMRFDEYNAWSRDLRSAIGKVLNSFNDNQAEQNQAIEKFNYYMSFFENYGYDALMHMKQVNISYYQDKYEIKYENNSRILINLKLGANGRIFTFEIFNLDNIIEIYYLREESKYLADKRVKEILSKYIEQLNNFAYDLTMGLDQMLSYHRILKRKKYVSIEEWKIVLDHVNRLRSAVMKNRYVDSKELFVEEIVELIENGS